MFYYAIKSIQCRALKSRSERRAFLVF